MENNKLIKRLEWSFYNCVDMSELLSFRDLTSLSILAQDLKVINGLSHLTQLTHLWICETKIQEIQQLDRLIHLKELYLYSNQIKKIQGFIQ